MLFSWLGVAVFVTVNGIGAPEYQVLAVAHWRMVQRQIQMDTAQKAHSTLFYIKYTGSQYDCYVTERTVFLSVVSISDFSTLTFLLYLLHGSFLLEKLTCSELITKFPAFYGTRRFITSFTIPLHLTLSWTRSIQSLTPHPTSWRSLLILSSYYAWVSDVDFSTIPVVKFYDSRHMKVTRLSALRTGLLYPAGDTAGTHFFQRLSRSQNYSAVGRIKSVKNPVTPSGKEPAAFSAWNAVMMMIMIIIIIIITIFMSVCQ
jgi:hypothetical protein